MHWAETESPPASAPNAARRRDCRRSATGLVSYLATVFVLISLNFFIPRAMPGDPIQALLAQGSDSFSFGADSKRKLTEYYGLDRSLLHQYGHYLNRLAHGDLGRSIASNAPVSTEMGRRLPWTILLIGGSIVLSTILGVAIGVHSGWLRDKPLDRVILTTFLAIREFPTFLLGSLLLFVFAVKLNWVPLYGAEQNFSEGSMLSRLLSIGSHLALPLLVLSVGLTVGNYLIMRAGMVSVLGSDYLMLGRAKGLSDRRLKYRYAARNALLPVVSLTALQIGFAITGDVIIEQVFSYRGLGGLIFESINERNYPVIQGSFLIISLSVVTISALVDKLNRRLDPRVPR